MPSAVIKKGKGKIFSIALAVILVCFFFFTFGLVVGKIGAGKLSFNVNPDLYAETELSAAFNNTLFKQVWTIIQDDYVDKGKLVDKDLFYGALAGFFVFWYNNSSSQCTVRSAQGVVKKQINVYVRDDTSTTFFGSDFGYFVFSVLVVYGRN